MEATTAPATAESTGSKTIADLLPKAAEKFADRCAVKYKDKASGEWRDVTFREVGEIVSEIGRGLIDLGIEPGDRVSLLCNTRAGVDVRGLRASRRPAPSSSRSTRRTPPRSASGSRATRDSVAIVCEDATQVAKIAAGPRQPAEPAARHRHRPGRATSATRSRSTSCASAAAGATRASCSSAPRRSRRTTRSPSSTRRARPGRRRAAS